jgi:glycosyltransferase involved in cell wall biosynthesis
VPATIGLYITYYNEQELLTDLICSVLSGEDRPDEIIIYDDYSLSPPQDFVPKNVSVKVIHGVENRGPAFGRNRLLEQAKADYVHFHDSDDFFLPNWLGRVRQVIKDYEPEAVFTEAATYVNGELQPSRIGLEKLERSQDLLGFCIENGMLVPAGTFSRKVLLSIGGYPETLWQSEDYAFHIRLAIRCPSYALIAEPLVGIRIRSNSRSSNQIEVYRDGLRGLKQIESEIPTSHQRQLADAAITISRKLYQLGDLAGARNGFSWATKLGVASYRHQHWGYRLCARLVGPSCAEMISAQYRKLPICMRAAVR